MLRTISARRGCAAALCVAFLSMTAPAPVRADATAGAALASKGAGATGAPPCAACHGSAGEGIASVAPRLAGLSKKYILDQLAAFRAGTRKNPAMQPVAAILSPPQAADVADYFSSVRAPSHPVSAAAALLTAGQALAERGRWSDGLPACDDCHAAKGIGVIPSFPYLAGQQADYLTRRIRAWRDGESHDDALGLMRAVASKLRDPDIAAVAAYYASLTAPARQGEN